MQDLVDNLGLEGFNVHSVANQLTIWSKSTRSPMASRIILDVHGDTWGPIRGCAKAVHCAALYVACYFDPEAMCNLKREMDNDPTIVDQSSEAAVNRGLSQG